MNRSNETLICIVYIKNSAHLWLQTWTRQTLLRWEERNKWEKQWFVGKMGGGSVGGRRGDSFFFVKGYYRDREGSRRPTVPIIDISGLGKYGPLKPSQKHTLLKSEDKPPLSRRYLCMCVGECVCVLQLKRPAFPVYVCTSVCTQLPCREINGLEGENETRGGTAGGRR